MKNHFTRRRFIVTASATASTVLGSSLFNLDSVFAAPYIRRNVNGMSASDPVLVSYGKAIKAMKALDSTMPLNPLSWTYQAGIHGDPSSATHTAWNTCEHGTHFFWSWHRMYLYWFERIIRKMSGDSSFALPYWDYSNASYRTLPPPFRDSSSQLYVSNRGTGWNSGSASFAASHVDPSGGMSFVDFFSGQSGIESNPHDNVHIDMGGLMYNIDTAAEDPIFYVHHSNIDRLWNLWLAQGGGRQDPLSDTTWKNNSYTFFDENGAEVHMTACDILRAAEQLNYTYEGEPSQVKTYCLKIIPFPIFYLLIQVLIQWPGPPVELTEREASISIDIRQFRDRLGSLVESKNETLLLELDNVEAARTPGAIWEVYLGLPPNAAPSPESPFFVGTVTLFSAGLRGQHHEFKPAHFTFNVRRAVATALRSKQEQLRLVFVPTGPLIDGKPSHPKVEAPVRIGKVALAAGRNQERKEGIAPETNRVEPQKPK